MHQNWSSLSTIKKNVDYGDRACKFWKVQITTVAYLDEAKSALPFGRRTDTVTHGTPDMWQRYCIMATLSPVYLFQHVLQRRLYSWLHRPKFHLTRHDSTRSTSSSESRRTCRAWRVCRAVLFQHGERQGLPNYIIWDSNVNLQGSCIVTEERLHECE